MRRLYRVAALAGALALGLSGCASNDPLANTEGNFSSADGAVVTIATANRAEPIDFTSTDTTDGSTIASSRLRGKPVVVNFWYASCPPCRAEAATLASVAHEYGERVTFIGVNVYDENAVARTFEKSFSIPYSSVLDVNTGSVRLAFASGFGPNAVPTTIVLDSGGRVAGRISGAIADESILASILDDVLGESE